MKRLIAAIKRMWGGLAPVELVEQATSGLNPTLEVVRSGDTIMLNAASTNYSFGGLHRVFRKAFARVGMAARKPEKVLILGFGAGSVASILLEELALGCRITAVEKDPEVIRLGRKYFDTGRFGGLELICEDAAAFVAGDENTYDLIVADVYVDFEVPASCETMAFVSDLCRCLAPGGMVMFNKLVYHYKARKEADELERKFRTLEGTTSVIRVREHILNKVIVFEKQHTNRNSGCGADMPPLPSAENT
jgi:spermidine synthase